MSKVILYGIPNCDTVKRARSFLDDLNTQYVFQNIKTFDALSQKLAYWQQQMDWQLLLNRKGTTWRQLTDSERDSAIDSSAALRLMLAQPSLVRRPVVEWPDGEVTVGFDPEQWRRRLGQ